MEKATLKVPVAMLRHGLYVYQLDRPWIETPFMFQGFLISSDEELDTLREYCAHVIIDVTRSDENAVSDIDADAESRDKGEDSVQPASLSERDRESAFGNKPFPRRERFRELVRIAHEARDQARTAIDSALSDARLGHAVDVPELREAVARMTRSVIGNASAALWLTTLKELSEYTAIHCINVCILSLTFGRHLGLSEAELRNLGIGSLLHDVGKARTPPEILEKPGSLTAEEFEIIKRHPEDGYQLMRDARHMSTQILDIIRLHHERMDGSGYPFGFTEEQIPTHVRLVSIIDAYDAMTSDRVYQSAKSPDAALKVLYESRGERFDNRLVEHFIRCIGIFPVGSVVELDTGAIAVVVAQNPNMHLQPTILFLRTPDGEPFQKRLLVNLAALSEQEASRFGRRIIRGLDPNTAGIDVPEVARQEFGLADVPQH